MARLLSILVAVTEQVRLQIRLRRMDLYLALMITFGPKGR